jgi:pimeloyl-ACP methyl ester carboxylesterase
MSRILRKLALYVLLAIILVPAIALAWLRWEAGRSQEDRFLERHGRLTKISIAESITRDDQVSEFITLHSDSGLTVSLRTIRDASNHDRLPVLIVLGGHRTGSDAVELFGHVGNRAVVALDYPYDGPEKVKGIVAISRTIPLARRAFLDTPPAVSLVMDWLTEQPWVDTEQVILVGASLGVPFAAASAARDKRITGALLIHGAADNRLWIETQIARRNDHRLLHKPVSTIFYWLAYGPTFDTAKNVAAIAPRPVLIIGARNDERTNAGQTEALFAAAREPKTLRWTEGQHIEPGRSKIVTDLLRIADEELPFDSEN